MCAVQTCSTCSWIFKARTIHSTSSFLYSDNYVFHQNSDLQHIIFRFSSFSRILAGNSVIYCGSDWGTFGSSSNSKLCQSTRSFFCLFFHPLHRPLFLSLTLHSLLCTYVPVDGDVKYLNTLCCLGTMHFSRWAIAAQTPMYANLHTKQPRMFSI